MAVTVTAGLSVLLALVNAYLSYRNAGLNAEVGLRQQTISQAIQLSPLNEQLSQLIGNLATQSGDIDLRAILERHGVTLNQTSAAPPTPAAAGQPPAMPAAGAAALAKP